jgi:hypothetical protein
MVAEVAAAATVDSLTTGLADIEMLKFVGGIARSA